MNILLISKTRSETLRTAKSLLEMRGHDCTVMQYESAAKTAEKLTSSAFDAVLVTENAALTGVSDKVHSVYLSSEFYCPERRMPTVQSCLIAHEELSFDFITHGARDKSVQVCGVPLRDVFRRRLPQSECRRALGLRENLPVFLMIGETVNSSTLKSAVQSIRVMCSHAQTILLGSGETRRKSWMSVFANDENVFISDLEMDIPLALCAADAVFTPAFSTFVCASARQEKIVTLLHSAVPRARKNATFFDAHGAAFHGKTAADSVSYACRLLESDRLRTNMISAQEKTILADAEDRLIRAIEV